MDAVFLVLDILVGVWLHCWSVPQTDVGESGWTTQYLPLYYDPITPRPAFTCEITSWSCSHLSPCTRLVVNMEVECCVCMCVCKVVEDDHRNNVGIGYTKMGSLLDKNFVFSHIRSDISKIERATCDMMGWMGIFSLSLLSCALVWCVRVRASLKTIIEIA